MDDLDQAEYYYKRALEYFPDSFDANIGLTEIYYRRGTFGSAYLQSETAKAKATNDTQVALALYWRVIGRVPSLTPEEARTMLESPSSRAALVDVRIVARAANPEEADRLIDPAERERLLRSSHELAHTADGQRVEVVANVGNVLDARTAAENGAERAGVMYSLLALTNKFGLGWAVGITFGLLTWLGFDPKIVNTPVAIAMREWKENPMEAASTRVQPRRHSSPIVGFCVQRIGMKRVSPVTQILQPMHSRMSSVRPSGRTTISQVRLRRGAPGRSEQRSLESRSGSMATARSGK